MKKIKDMMREMVIEFKEVRKSKIILKQKQQISSLLNKIQLKSSHGDKNNIAIKGVNFSKDNLIQFSTVFPNFVLQSAKQRKKKSNYSYTKICCELEC